MARQSIDLQNVKRVLVVRLRSIGDTVLATPTLTALVRALPNAEIDIVLEEWVAPLLEGFPGVNVVRAAPGNIARARAVKTLRGKKYDIAFNLHGGSTSSTFVAMSGARRRFGLSHYRYPLIYTDMFGSAADFWGTDQLHSAEQQLALVGFAGVPVEDRPSASLPINAVAEAVVEARFGDGRPIALLHPIAAFATKEWPLENFARIAESLFERGFKPVAVGSPAEIEKLKTLQAASQAAVEIASDLSLPEITALAARAEIFVGNDSGIAHIAAAVDTPSVVVFGSSNRVHWRPWTAAPNEIVFNEFACQPCSGFECREFGEPRCILSVEVESVEAAIQRVLGSSRAR